MIKNKIQRSFSKASLIYDSLNDFHISVGDSLLDKISLIKPPSGILDVGMGTGNLTNKIRDKFKNSMIVGLDFSSGMIDVANKNYKKIFHIVQADAQSLPFKENSFDLIVSNIVYQWIVDLRKALKECYSVLKDDGKIIFAMLGYETFKELFFCFEKCVKRKKSEKNFFNQRLLKEEQIVDSVTCAKFKDVEINKEELKLIFPSMLELIKWVKKIGANNLKRDYFVGRDLLIQANDYYSENFRENGGVFASCEIIWIKAGK